MQFNHRANGQSARHVPGQQSAECQCEQAKESLELVKHYTRQRLIGCHRLSSVGKAGVLKPWRDRVGERRTSERGLACLLVLHSSTPCLETPSRRRRCPSDAASISAGDGPWHSHRRRGHPRPAACGASGELPRLDGTAGGDDDGGQDGSSNQCSPWLVLPARPRRSIGGLDMA